MSSDSRSPDFPTPVGGADSPCEGHATYTSLRSATPFLRYTPSLRRGGSCRLV